MNLWHKFCTLSRLSQVALIVFGLHSVIVCALCVHHFIFMKKPVPAKIAIRTIRSTSAKVNPQAGSKTVQKGAPSRSGAPTRVVKTGVKTQKPTASKKSSPTSQSLSHKTGRQDANELLLQEIAQNLDLLETPFSPSSRSSLTLPSALPTAIQVEPSDSSPPNGADRLISFLENVLDLPEYGTVKVHMTIDSEGKLTHLTILEMQNKKNADFLKKRLPELVFPGSCETTVFTVTFKNQT